MNPESGNITWVLVQEPTIEIERAIEVVETRLNSVGEIAWVAPVADPLQD